MAVPLPRETTHTRNRRRAVSSGSNPEQRPKPRPTISVSARLSFVPELYLLQQQTKGIEEYRQSRSSFPAKSHVDNHLKPMQVLFRYGIPSRISASLEPHSDDRGTREPGLYA